VDKLYKIISEMTLDEKTSALCLDMYITKTEANARLGIDGLEFEYAAHGLSKFDPDTGQRYDATCFPAPSALGRSWSRDCIKQTAQTIAEEAREQDICAVFAPQLNIRRSLRGADDNCFSEDPFLCAELGIAFAEGLQTRGIGACVNYFGMVSAGKYSMNADHAADERALREIYLYALNKSWRNAVRGVS
jgi:beta-glucosidase